jgi:hypothetical protein
MLHTVAHIIGEDTNYLVHDIGVTFFFVITGA